MDKDSLLRQGMSAGMAAGAGRGSLDAMPIPDVAQTEGPWSPEHHGFDDQLRRLCTRARWGLSDRDVVSIIRNVISELHMQLEVANKEG